MKKLLVLVLLAGLLVAGDLSAKAFAQTKLEQRARQSLPGTNVSVRIHSFPFLPRLLLGGKVSEIDFAVHGVEAGSFSLGQVDVDLNGVQLDRDLLIKKRKAELVGINRGIVAVELTAAQLSDAVHREVRIAAGKVSVNVAGRYVDATVKGEGSAILLTTAGLATVVIPVTKANLIPCLADATVLAGRIRVSCAIDEIPPALVRAASRAQG